MYADDKPYGFTPHQAPLPHILGQRNNVCGIKSKLLNPDFEQLIKKNDILFFVEIKTVEFDHLDLPDKFFFAKHRKRVNRKSGGIVIIIKKYLSKNMNIVQ